MISAATAVPVAAYCLLPFCVLQIVLTVRADRRRLGERRECFLRPYRLQFFGVMLVTPVLIGLNFFREFDLIVRLAITGVGVLGFYIAFHDMFFARMGGLYENGLVWHGSRVFFDELDFIERPDPYTVVFQTLDRNRITVVLGNSSAADRIAVHAELASGSA